MTLSGKQVKGTRVDEEETPFVDVPIPEDMDVTTFGRDALITLWTDWTPPGSNVLYPAGELIIAPMADLIVNR